MRRRAIWMLIGFASGLLAVSRADEPALIPLPANVAFRPGTWELKPDARIAYLGGKVARREARNLAARLRPPTGYALPVRSGAQGDVVLRIDPSASKNPEGYRLRITPTGVEIRAPQAAGLFYAGETLRQMLPPAVFSPERTNCLWKISCAEIEDAPRFPWRGMMLDCSRYFFPKQDVKRFIDEMAKLKLNVFHWHLTDDQGWRLEIRKYPKLTEVGAWREETIVGHLRNKDRRYDGKRYGGFYTQDDVREIVAYAAERHVSVVPEIDMPGHSQAAVAAYPELGCSTNPPKVKTEWGVSADVLSPEESTIRFCEDVLREVMELFPSEYVHVGGDEVRKDLWKASARIRALRRERGLKDLREMQSWFTRRIGRFLNANGRKLIGWDEICEGGSPPSAAVMWWRPNARDAVRAAAEAGSGVVLARYDRLYFDYYQRRDKSREPLAIGGFLSLRKTYGFDPLPSDWSPAAKRRVLGMQGQVWTEYVPTLSKAEYMAFPRGCALAERAWSPEDVTDYADFFARLKGQFRRFDVSGTNYRRPGEEDVPGKSK